MEEGEKRDIPRERRCGPLFLNQTVQVGTLDRASGFPLEADVHNCLFAASPGYGLGSRKYPGRCRAPQEMS
jgi:hypothetical protein